jgi:hypothetical protein
MFISLLAYSPGFARSAAVSIWAGSASAIRAGSEKNWPNRLATSFSISAAGIRNACGAMAQLWLISGRET